MNIKGKNWFTILPGSMIEDHDEENDITRVHVVKTPIAVYIDQATIEVDVASATQILSALDN